MICRLIVPLALVLLFAQINFAWAESTSPEPQAGASSEACMKDFAPLREEAENRGKLIKAASARRAPANEACKLIGDYSQAEIKMIKYLDVHGAECEIPPRIAEQLKNGHKTTEALEKKVCDAAMQLQNREPSVPGLWRQ